MYLSCLLLAASWLTGNQPVGGSDPIQATATELATALYYNQAAFDTRYDGKRMIVVGKATTIRRTDEPGQYVLSMRVGSRDYAGQISFLFNGHQQALARLEPPTQEVTIEGTMSEKSFSEAGGVGDLSIRFIDCRLIVAGPLAARQADRYSLTKRLRASASLSRSAASSSGYFRSNCCMAPARISDTMARVAHFWSAGTMYQGAHSVLVWLRASA
jgi:hypothetical protein